MFNTRNFSADLFTRAARGVLGEAKDAMSYAKKVLSRVARLGMKVGGKFISALEKMVARLQKVIGLLERQLKAMTSGRGPDLKALSKIAAEVAEVMGEMARLTDRIAAFAESNFVKVFATGQSAMKALADKLSAKAKAARRGVDALGRYLAEALKADWAQDLKRDVEGALKALNDVVPILEILDLMKRQAGKLIATLDLDLVAKGAQKFAGDVLNRLFDNAIAFAEAVQLRKRIEVLAAFAGKLAGTLRGIADKAAARTATILLTTLRKVIGVLDQVQRQLADAAGAALKTRTKALAEAKLVESRLAKVRDPRSVQADVLKRLSR